MDWKQQLRNAIYDIKFRNLPGTHVNGIYQKELTVNEALDLLAQKMGVRSSNPQPLYWIEEDRLYSRVTSRYYDIEPAGNGVLVKYDDEWHGAASPREAMNFINQMELLEPPTDHPIHDGHFEHHN